MCIFRYEFCLTSNLSKGTNYIDPVKAFFFQLKSTDICFSYFSTKNICYGYSLEAPH